MSLCLINSLTGHGFCLFQNLAAEIILTLGQAFEVAYQIALRESEQTLTLERDYELERQLSESEKGLQDALNQVT